MIFPLSKYPLTDTSKKSSNICLKSFTAVVTKVKEKKVVYSFYPNLQLKFLYKGNQMAIFLIIEEKDSVRSVEMTGEQLIIGRSQKADIIVADGLCSGLHCSVGIHEGMIMVKDLGSKNGTWVNGTKTIQNHQLLIGDKIEIPGAKISINEEKLNEMEREQLGAIVVTSGKTGIGISLNSTQTGIENKLLKQTIRDALNKKKG